MVVLKDRIKFTRKVFTGDSVRFPFQSTKLLFLQTKLNYTMQRSFLRIIPALLGVLMAVTPALAQNPAAVTKGNYNLAARFSPKKLSKLIFSTSVDPHWMRNSDRFWYTWESPSGKKWYIVDPAKATKTEMFDTDKMAADITRIVKDPFDGQHLQLDNLEFIKNETAIRFEVRSTEEVEKKDTATKKDSARRATPPAKEKKTFYFEYNLQTRELKELTDYEKPKRRPMWASIAPDSSMIVFAKNHNLYWMDKENLYKAIKNEDDSTIVDHQITKDGIEDFGFGRGYGETDVEKEKNKNKRKGAYVLWSPDSKFFTTTLSDVRKVNDLWVINNVAEPRPTLETYKYHMPGEANAPIEYLIVFDATTKQVKKLDVGRYKDQSLGLWASPWKPSDRDVDFRPSTWLGTNTKFYMNRTSRDLKKIDVCMVDAASGKVTPVIEEKLNTYVEIRQVALVNGGKELIQWSEKDGWAHFYLYDENGKLKNQITSGAFHCEEIVEVDEKNRVLYFTANGRESLPAKGKDGVAEKEDPYYVHLYRVNFDGTGLKLLNPGNFDHSSSMGDSYKYFVNNSSRVNTTPESVLMDNTGKLIMKLETADLSNLFAAGYKFPEPFKVKADDGITDLFGVMYKPFDFDSTKKYPIIEYVYPGPQTEAVNKAFGRSMDRIDRLAQFGFIVVTVGNRGGHPSRSKWYHNYGYNNLRDYGLADKKATVEQLAVRYPFIDADRVGITGHSGGGFMSTAAMLVYPDFFKVAVSGAGNHENNIYNRWWSEKHHGVKEIITPKGDTTFQYNIERNPELAKNLKGKLLLVTGDIDNNVHPANTIRMANALIKANKRFDFMLMPGQRHGFGDMTEYFFWLMGDYFCKYLLGDFSQPVDIMEINREVEQTGNKRR